MAQKIRRDHLSMSRRNVIAYLKARLSPTVDLPAIEMAGYHYHAPTGPVFPQLATIIVPLRGGISTTGYHYHTPTGLRHAEIHGWDNTP